MDFGLLYKYLFNRHLFLDNIDSLPSKTLNKTEYSWFSKIRKYYIDDKLTDSEVNLYDISIFKQ